ncbi:MAG TPA: LpqB family beta-propeller domain-containing protein [Gemmatimonadales bacterium]|nr:LpqB family beta-propeller domain-containing protein [Gemmatimonadales bacterium]
MSPSSRGPLYALPRRRCAAFRSAAIAAVFGAPIASGLAGELSAQTIAEVQVSPQTLTLGIGQHQAIFAAAFDRKGNLIPNARFTFWSSDSTIARIESDGIVTGVRAGLAKVEARIRNRRASLAVLVGGVDSTGAGGENAVAALTIAPAALHLLPGEKARLTPQAVQNDGSAATVARVAWKSLRADVAAVDSGGTVVGLAPGRTIVQASAGGITATAAVDVSLGEVALSATRLVLPPGGADTLHVTVPAEGNRAVDSGMQWRSSDTTVARVDSAGVVRAFVPGTATIAANGFRRELRATVVVYKTPTAVVLSPPPSAAPIQLPVGERHKFTAVAEASDSTPVPEVRVAWEVGDGTVAGFDSASGELTAKSVGNTTLTARVAGFEPAVWHVSVVPGTLRLERTCVGLAPHEHVVIGATLLDGQGRAAGAASDLRWTSDRPDVAAVDARGDVAAAGVGHAILSAATTWGTTARLDVFVSGEFLLASSRYGTFGILQALTTPDTLRPVLADSAQNTQPVFSPDRTRIAFSSNRARRDGNFDLYVMDADGRDIRRLTQESGTDGEPAWTPDGSHLVFTSARSGSRQLYLIPVEAGAATPLTSGPGENHSPAVSPDGKTIAFVSTRDGSPRVYRMDIDGGHASRATASALPEASPRFFPNGDLAWGVERGKGSREWRVLRMQAGGSPVPLFETDQPLAAFAPSRDGERVVYVTRRASRGTIESRVLVRGLARNAAPTVFPLHPGEQVASVSF